MRTCPFKQNSLLICQAMQHSEVQVWPKSNIQLCKSKMMYSKFRCKLLANDSSIFIWVLIAEYYCARGAQLVKAIRLLRGAVIWPMLYLVIRNNSFTFTFTDYSSNAGYMQGKTHDAVIVFGLEIQDFNIAVWERTRVHTTMFYFVPLLSHRSASR